MRIERRGRSGWLTEVTNVSLRVGGTTVVLAKGVEVGASGGAAVAARSATSCEGVMGV